MRRRLFNLLAALSLLAGIAVAGVWVRSYWVVELYADCFNSATAPTYGTAPPQRNDADFLYAPFVLILLTLPAMCAVRTWRRFQRERQGHCRQCGYDLRATPERCPECGTEAEKLIVGS
jgi:hypothetical protein